MTQPAAQRRRRLLRRWRAAGAAGVGASLAIVVMALVAALSGGDPPGHDSPSPTEVPMPRRIAYVPYWDQDRAFEVVRQNLDLLDEVSPVWYSLDSRGHVVLADAENTTVDRSTVQALREHGIRVIPTVTNLRDGEWDPLVVRTVLHDPTAMTTHVNALVELAVTEGYDGIDIDYEDLRAADRSAFSRFVAELGAALRAEGKLLTVAVHPKTSDAGYDERNLAQDYRAIGAAADQVRVMTYDYSWESSPAGPQAPARWVEQVIAWTVSQVPPDKVILGVVVLGYDWTDGGGVTVDYEQARSTAQAHGATIRRSDDGTPWYRYRDPSGNRHEVWYEDAKSAGEKLELVSRYGLGGAFVWRLGGEDPDVWRAIRAAPWS
ncbi:peptidoglycan hydrolase [Jiangella aurantiaca]|uniref:Peptidoglycan hydrolase n=1 Tax=Jiangella aurantiaca TaxID=2530373 RepID=A0A4R5ADR4_9ACTN|nr:glycosyl hydrolase family 18 protein [Jiangella aurantiaca]TDD70638.1 peptidoglycan hydrolase [Jiangella aurantiaca]